MKKKLKLLYWTPRILAVLFAVFISLFALDVFGEYTFPEVLVALFMHLIPTYLLIIATIIAWKKERLGGIIFLALGLFYIVITCTKINSIPNPLSGPMIVIGILFLISSLKRFKARKE